ncbi:MAG: archease [Chloroflexi bacterium]|nr:archease [Chloroflexota bacterium]
MASGFEITDHTADIGLRAWGKDVRDAFVQAATGLFSIICDLDEVQERESREVSVSAEEREDLLVDWLSEMLYLFDAELLLLRRFDIKSLQDGKLTATVYGETAEPGRHHIKLGVKAVTYHQLRVEERDGCQVEVIFDI